MKLSFSTLGCPGWQWNEIFAAAKDLGLDGIELRGIENEINTTKAEPFLPNHIAKTISMLQNARLAVPVVTSGACIGVTNRDKEENLTQAREHIDLAQKLGAPYVRIMATPEPFATDGYDKDLLIENYRRLCVYAGDKAVTPLLETNGQLADSNEMLSVMETVHLPNTGVLWDIHHPYRFFGEQPSDTCGKLGNLIKHVHVKDSVMKGGKVEYRMMGYGDIPVLDSLRELKAYDYAGFVSLEWVKRWNPDLEEPGVVFYHFKMYMDYILTQL